MSNVYPTQIDQITFSDFDAVKMLIKLRHTVDPYRGIEIDRDINNAGVVREMSPDLIIVYVALDELIKKCNLNIKQRYIVNKIMDGYTEKEVAEEFNHDQSQITKILNTICKRIVAENNKDWLYEYVYMSKLKAPFDYKQCSKCLEFKPMTIDFFNKEPLGKDGFKNKCKQCSQVSNRNCM